MKTIILEHNSSSYAPRTYHNAQIADLTAAFAIDFSTAGEKLTNKAAQEKYIRCDLRKEPIELARQLYKGCRAYHTKTLNIAGNGIYTFTSNPLIHKRILTRLFMVLCLKCMNIIQLRR